MHKTLSERIAMGLSIADCLRCLDAGLRDDRSREFTLKLSGVSRGEAGGAVSGPMGRGTEA